MITPMPVLVDWLSVYVYRTSFQDKGSYAIVYRLGKWEFLFP